MSRFIFLQYCIILEVFLSILHIISYSSINEEAGSLNKHKLATSVSHYSLRHFFSNGQK